MPGTRFAASNRGAAPLLAVRPAATRRGPAAGPQHFRRIGWSTGPRSRAGLPLRPGCNRPTREQSMSNENVGKIVQVMGPVVDVQFSGRVPEILTALEDHGERPGASCWRSRSIWARASVRTMAMDGTDGPQPRHGREGHGRPDHCPGRPRDARPHHERGRRAGGRAGPRSKSPHKASIHHAAPTIAEQATHPEVRVTGIKVVDLICPYLKGGKIGPVRRRRRRQDRDHPRADQQHRQGAWRLLRLRRRRRALALRATTSTGS